MIREFSQVRTCSDLPLSSSRNIYEPAYLTKHHEMEESPDADSVARSYLN